MSHESGPYSELGFASGAMETDSDQDLEVAGETSSDQELDVAGDTAAASMDSDQELDVAAASSDSDLSVAADPVMVAESAARSGLSCEGRVVEQRTARFADCVHVLVYVCMRAHVWGARTFAYICTCFSQGERGITNTRGFSLVVISCKHDIRIPTPISCESMSGPDEVDSASDETLSVCDDADQARK